MNRNPDIAAPFEDLVSVREAAALLRVSESTVWRWISEDVLPSYRVGRKRIYLKRAELAPMLQPAYKKAHGLSEADRERLNAFPMSSPTPGVDPMEQARAFRERLRARRGDQRWPEAWEDINEMRDERSREQD